MARLEKSTAVYKTPFSKGYWRDAVMELKDTKMLVFAALIIALRVALKTLVKILSYFHAAKQSLRSSKSPHKTVL